MGFPVDKLGTEYPFNSHFLDRGGYRLHYLDEGHGEPLVMLHGNPTWSFLYRRFAAALRDSYRVVVPDHTGCGLSDRPDYGAYRYTLDDRVSDLEALLAGLGLEQELTLFLHDWGGLIGMAFAARHPERIRRLVVFNTSAFLLPAGKRLHWTIRFSRNSRLAAFLILKHNAFARVAVRMGCASRPMPKNIREAYTEVCGDPPGRRTTLRFVHDIPLSPTDVSYSTAETADRSLGRFSSIPVLICWGMRDFVFDQDFLEEWLRRFPAADVHRFARAGHYVTEEEFENILPLVRSFLDRNRP